MAPWHYLKGILIVVSRRRGIWQPSDVEVVVLEIMYSNNGLKRHARPGVLPHCTPTPPGGKISLRELKVVPWGHARESADSGWNASRASTAFGGMAASRAVGPRRSGRVAYQQGEGPLYIPRGATRRGMGHAFVGAGHARESADSGWNASRASIAFGGMAPSYRRHGPPLARSGSRHHRQHP